MKLTILALLILALSNSAAIPTPLTVKENEKLSFKIISKLTIKTTSQTPQAGKFSISKVKEPTENKNIVRKEIYSWWTDPIGSELQDGVKIVQEKITVNNVTAMCVQKTYQFSKSSYVTMNLNQPSSVLYPGSLIQGKSIKTGAEPLKSLPISSDDRFPIQIATPKGFIASALPNSKDVLEKIKKSLSVQKSDITIGFAKTEDLPAIYQAMNFNQRVVQKIGISSESPIKSDRLYIFMLQVLNEYYPAMFSQDESFVDDAIGVFLKNSFTLDKVQKLQDLLVWGQNNIPCYVDRVFYGRFLAVSVALNQKNKQIYEELSSQPAKNADITAELLTRMFNDPTILAYGKGVYSKLEIEDLKSGNWQKFFSQDPSRALNQIFLQPIAFSLSDFRGQPVKFSNAIKYKLEQCSPKNF